MKIKRILYLGWLNHGNVGDDLLFSVFKELIIKEALKYNIGLIIDDIHEEYSFFIENYDLVILGGGSLLVISFFLDICERAKAHLIPVIIWGSGIDERVKSNVDKVLYSYFNNTYFDNVDKVLNDYYKLKSIIEYSRITGVRGNLTKHLLPYNKVKVIGDPGIIIDKFNYKYPVITEIDHFLGDGRNVVLINWGSADNYILGGNENKAFESLKFIIQFLLTGNAKVLLYPIWTEDITSCENLANMFQSKNLLYINETFDFYGIAYLIKKSSYSINLKLHANILSMAYEKPFISLAYGLKCYDFAESIHALDLVIPTDSVTPDKILEKIDYIEKNYINIQNLFRKEIDIIYGSQYTFMEEVISIIRSK